MPAPRRRREGPHITKWSSLKKCAEIKTFLHKPRHARNRMV